MARNSSARIWSGQNHFYLASNVADFELNRLGAQWLNALRSKHQFTELQQHAISAMSTNRSLWRGVRASFGPRRNRRILCSANRIVFVERAIVPGLSCLPSNSENLPDNQTAPRLTAAAPHSVTISSFACRALQPSVLDHHPTANRPSIRCGDGRQYLPSTGSSRA